MTRIDHTAASSGSGGVPATRAWERGGGPSRSSAPVDETPRRPRTYRFVFAADFLPALYGRGVHRAIYLASVFACVSAPVWMAPADPALADTAPPDTLHSPYVSAERAREAGLVARKNPVPRPTLLEREPAGEGPTYASGDQGSGSLPTFEDVSQPNPAQQEFAQIGRPNSGSSGGSPPITFGELQRSPPADAPTARRKESAVTEPFPPTASAPPSSETSGGELPPSARPGPLGDIIPTPKLVPEGELENPPAEEPQGASEEDVAVDGSPPATDEGPQDTSGKVPPQTSTEVAEDPPVEDTPSDEEAPGEPPTGDLLEEGEVADDQYASEDGTPSESTLPPVAQAGNDVPHVEEPPSSGEPDGHHPDGQQPPEPPAGGEDDGPSGDQYDTDRGDEIPPVEETPPTPDADPPADEVSSPEDPQQPGPDDPQRSDIPGQTNGPGQGGADAPTMPDDVEKDLKSQLDGILERVRASGIIEERNVSGGTATPQEQELLHSLNEANAAVEMARDLAAEAPEAREERERARERARSAIGEAGRAADQATQNETPDGGTGNGRDVPSGEALPQPALMPQTPPRGSSPTDEPTTQSPPAEAPPEEAPTPPPTMKAGPPPKGSHSSGDSPEDGPPEESASDGPQSPDPTTTPPMRNTREEGGADGTPDRPESDHPEPGQPESGESAPKEGPDDAQRSQDAGSSGEEPPEDEEERTSGGPAKEIADGRQASATADPPITDAGVELKPPEPRTTDSVPVEKRGADRDDEKSADHDGNGGR